MSCDHRDYAGQCLEYRKAEAIGVVANEKPYFDKKEQLQKIEAGLLTNEHVIGVFDMKGGGTGFLGITNKRVVIFDKAFMRKMKAVVSIPYSRITSIAAEDDGGWASGRGFMSTSNLVVRAGSEQFEFEFRGADKAHMAHDMILVGILD